MLCNKSIYLITVSILIGQPISMQTLICFYYIFSITFIFLVTQLDVPCEFHYSFYNNVFGVFVTQQQ